MTKFNVRDIFNTPRLNIWNIENHVYEVLHEDNIVVNNNKKEIIFNRYIWELFNLYPNTPIVSKCNINIILNNGYFNADTHIKSLEAVFKHICEYNNLNYYYQKDSLLKYTLYIVNLIFNEIVHRVTDYVSSIDALDFIELINKENINKIHKNIKPTPESIESAYKEIKQYITTTDDNNRFVKAYKSKSINENQANQCIGPRGFVSGLDRYVYKQPILNGFIKGMGNLFELITESLTAAKSLNANDTHIKTSEYTSRRIQLLSMSVTGVEIQDCGSTEYMDLFVTKDILEVIKGKYYLKEDNTLDYIRGNETNLIGNIIRIRTSLGCRTPDPSKICTICLGKISENFKENSNLGYTMTAFLMEKLTQSILSTKHLTHSVKKSSIKLSGVANKYFHVDKENDIYFHENLNLKNLYLILSNSRLNKLTDVLNLSHSNISLNKIGELETVIIRNTNNKNITHELVDISYKDRLSIITRYLLEYIKSVKIECDSKGNFIIPLDHFNKKFPIFNNPLKETNVILFINKIADIIESNKNKITDPYEKLNNLFSVVNDQLKINLSVLEVIIYATTVYDILNNDYRLSRNSLNKVSSSKSSIFRYRNLSQLLVFEKQIKEILNSPVVMFSDYNNHYRSYHPMDVLFKPQEVILDTQK